jgi:hypothetical protein
MLSLFVMDLPFPGQRISLNIFEPRYRLLIRRAMEGSRVIGMTLSMNVVCLCEILDAQCQQDGRYHVQMGKEKEGHVNQLLWQGCRYSTSLRYCYLALFCLLWLFCVLTPTLPPSFRAACSVGRSRWTINRDWEQDGYRVAQCTRIRDDVAQIGTPEITALCEDMSKLTTECLAQMSTGGFVSNNGSTIMEEFVSQAGEMPPTSDPERLSFWLAAVLPLNSDQQKLEMFSSTSPVDRLNLLKGIVDALCVQRQDACNVM